MPISRLGSGEEAGDSLMLSEKPKRTYLVVGLGRVGSSLALRLAEIGAHVIAVDKTRSRVDDLSGKLEYIAQLDATDEAALLKIGAKDVDVAVICLGEKMEDAILVTAVLQELHVPKIVVRANSDLQARILAKIGADEIIRPETEIGRRTADLLENPWLSQFAELGDENHVTGKIDAPDFMLGKNLKDLALPAQYGTMVMVIERDGKKYLPAAEFTVEHGDVLWVFGDKRMLSPLLNAITEKAPKSMEESQ